jgi:rod shape-determining protein MreB
MFGWEIELGIDLGTANTTIYRKGTGIVLTEPSVVAYSTRTGKLLAAGREAKLMADQRAEEVRSVRPLRGGAVADPDAAAEMLRAFLLAATGQRLFMPKAVAGITTGSSPVEEHALRSVIQAAGARRLRLMDTSLAGALGANCPINDPRYRMIVNLGAGSTDIAVISLGGVVVGRSLRFGGDDLDETIRRFIKRKYGLAIPLGAAESIKVQAGAVASDLAPAPVSVNGRRLYGELFQDLSVTLEGIPERLARAVESVAVEIHWMLDELSPDQRADIRAVGLTLIGGTSLLRGLPQLMTRQLGMPAVLGRNPSTAVAVGIGTAMEDLTKLSLEGRRYAAVAAG